MNTDHLTLPDPQPTGRRPTAVARRFGYLIAIAVNAVLLYAVNNLLGWDVVPFLTDDLELAIPLINLSLIVTMVVNLSYVFFDDRWFKSITQIGLASASLAATVRLYQVFPFDFSAYDFGWDTLARTVLIIAIVGIVISIFAEAVKLLAAGLRLVKSI
ncbi:MAG TPA: hypothetical protein VLT15_01695 [Acidimicrobiia bacterium]|nr:hypothetical protein [Acidimicrobiia bacterium]